MKFLVSLVLVTAVALTAQFATACEGCHPFARLRERIASRHQESCSTCAAPAACAPAACAPATTCPCQPATTLPAACDVLPVAKKQPAACAPVTNLPAACAQIQATCENKATTYAEKRAGGRFHPVKSALVATGTLLSKAATATKKVVHRLTHPFGRC
jgi:hypothetical protein